MRTPLPFLAPCLAAAVPLLIALPASRAQTPPVQVGEPVTVKPSSSNPADTRGFVYEKHRIKRTVPLDPAQGFESRWDLLYKTGDTATDTAAYFDWDDDYLYFGIETAALPGDIRIDVDGRGDGWFRGADNLSFVVSPPATPGGEPPRVSARRWDTVQNKDRPVWAASPIAVGDVKSAFGAIQGASGRFATMLAIPRTETIGLARTPGQNFGARIEPGYEARPDDDPTAYTPRPMLPLSLDQRVTARAQGLVIQVEALPREVVPGEPVRLLLDVKNEGTSPVSVARLFLRGSLAAQPLVDAGTFTGQTIKPGETVKRQIRTPVGGSGFGALVVTGGIEREDGSAVAALAAFTRFDPFSVRVDLDEKPIPAGTRGDLAKRQVLVTVQGRGKVRSKGRLSLLLPPGWTLENNADRGRDITVGDEIKAVRFQVVVPASATPGRYLIQADVKLDGRTYTASGLITVGRGSAPADG